MSEYSVQPLEGSVELQLDPARGGCDILSVVVCPPSLDETDADDTHLAEFIDRLKSVVDRLSQERGKLLVVEDLQAVVRQDLADSGRVEVVAVVEVSTLDEDAAATHALSKDFTSEVTQVHSLPNVTPSVFYSGVSVDVGQCTQAEAINS